MGNSKIVEFKYHTLPDDFSQISVDVYKAMRLGKRGLAVTLWLQEVRKMSAAPSDNTITPLTAGKVIDEILERFENDIKNCPVLVCGDCSVSLLPRKDMGVSFIEISDISERSYFVCNTCIKNEEERRANLYNIHPPPFNEWPAWVKEAFGPAKHLEKSI